jgi:hypothetical protein
MTLIEATAQLAHVGNGLWVGTIPAPNRYGSMELVLGGTAEAPKAEHIAAIEAFMPNVLETIAQLHGRLFFSFLWDPVRLAVHNQNRVGVQFQRRLLPRREILSADEMTLAS